MTVKMVQAERGDISLTPGQLNPKLFSCLARQIVQC